MEHSTQHLSSQPSPPVPTIATRLYVPGWWVRAWEQALHKQQMLELSPTPGLDSVLMPSLDIGQLNLIAVLCAELQQQMLQWSPREPLRLHWNEVKKLISSADTASVAKLSTALEQLGGLRLNLQEASDSIKDVIPLFLTERWAKNSDDPNDIVLTLVPNEQTLELLIGYSDGHIDLLRKTKGEPGMADVLAEVAPLVLWKPVWLELALAEQAVYLRLEKSMQWDMTWLQLDGVFGATVDELFSNVRIAKRASASNSVLMERLRVCGRLGRKLVSHGVIAREPQSNFFAVSSDSKESSLNAKGPSLIWQASSERLLSHEENAHFGRAAQAMLAHLIGPAMPELLKVLASGTEFATGTRHMELQNITDQLKKVPSGAIRIGSAVLIQAQVLFLEWSLRKMTGSLYPLPPELLRQDILQLCRLDSQSPELFRRFCERALSTPEVSRIFSEIPHASLANLPKTAFEAILPKLRSALRTITSHSVTAPIAKIPVIQAATSPDLPTVHADLVVKPAPTIDAGQSALLRIAREELEKMMKADQRSFSALKDSYLKSLDEPQRQLMCDVERRMKPQLFDQQLKQRLVRFMVEHPSTWKSTSQILQ